MTANIEFQSKNFLRVLRVLEGLPLASRTDHRQRRPSVVRFSHPGLGMDEFGHLMKVRCLCPVIFY